MPFFLLILLLLPFSLIIYFAVSKKSNPPVKKAALIALILAAVSLMVCAVLVFSEPVGIPGPGIEEIPDRPVPSAPVNFWYLLLFALIFLFFFGIVAYVALRERRKGAGSR